MSDETAVADAQQPETEQPAPAPELGHRGRPFDRKAPYMVGLLGGFGLLTAYAFSRIFISLGSTLILIVVSLFIAAGLDPLVRWLERRGLRRSMAVLVVIVGVIGMIALFVFALAPVIADQVRAIGSSAPDWLDRLQHNQRIRDLDEQYGFIEHIQSFVTNGNFASRVFGGVLGVGLAVLNAFFNSFIIIVLTLYFLGSFETLKKAAYSLAPGSRRERVGKLGDRIIEGIGGYVSGAFVIALCAGITSLILLFSIGMGRYAVALAFVVMVTDVIPMIGATIGAVIVTAICFADSVQTGVIAAIFYIAYQQFENYVIYPRVMSRSVEIPGVLTVIAALVGASLMGVVGALLAIPTAAAILMLVREVFVKAQDER
ncbi:MAG: AI-2E family transporter [Nocardioides sp.]